MKNYSNEKLIKTVNAIQGSTIIPTITRLKDGLNNLNEKKHQLLINIPIIEKTIDITTAPEAIDTLNSTLDSYRNDLKEANESIKTINTVLKPLEEVLKKIENEEG